MNGIDMPAFYSELAKIAASTQARPSTSPWSTKTVGAPRSKLTPQQSAKAPTIPSGLNVKIVSPSAQFGPRQNYSQPYEDNAPSANPTQVGETRNTPPPNVVFGSR